MGKETAQAVIEEEYSMSLKLFEKQPNFVGERAIIALHILSVLYMAGVFFMGMMWEKKQHKR